MKILLVALLLVVTPPAFAAEWRFGELKIEWIDGFQQRADHPIEFCGPGGERVLITVLGHKGVDERGELRESFLRFGEVEIPRLSAKQGEEVVKLRRDDLKGGVALFTTAAIPRRNKKMFYLQFFAVSRQGRAALFTVEGVGDPQQEVARFRPLFDSLVWNEPKG